MPEAPGGMELAEQGASQDGRDSFKWGDQRYEMCVSVGPTCYGERLVARALPGEGLSLALSDVGLSGEGLSTVKVLCRLPRGMIIVSGPTGCGKTTLLYCMLMAMNRDSQSVVSVEDSVEF